MEALHSVETSFMGRKYFNTFLEKLHTTISTVASDISTTMLDRARQGIYGMKRVMPVPPVQRNTYMTGRKIEGERVFEVNASVKSRVVFTQMNLMEKWPIRVPLDFIFCRNVMIYFDKPTQKALIDRYWQQLEDGGFLFTGHSESLTGIDHKFEYVRASIYQKV